MSDTEIKTLWNSPENAPDSRSAEREANRFLKQLRTRRRGFVAVMGLAGVWLVIILARIAFFVGAEGMSGLGREWGALLMAALPVAALLVFTAEFRRHCRGHANPGRSIRDGLAALLDENRLARRRLRMIALLYGAVLIVVPVVASQLRAVGKAGDEILVPVYLMLPILMLSLAGGLFLWDRKRLAPRGRELAELLAAYQ